MAWRHHIAVRNGVPPGAVFLATDEKGAAASRPADLKARLEALEQEVTGYKRKLAVARQTIDGLRASRSAIDQSVHLAAAYRRQMDIRRERERADSQTLHESEGRLRRSMQALERANAAKSRILAAVAHDFRQPLTVIAGMLALLEGRVGDERGRGYLGQANAAAEKLERELNMLQRYVLLATGRMTLDLTDFPINLVLEEAQSEGEVAARARGLDFRVVPCRAAVRSDRHLLGSIVQNFVSNAIRYTPAPGRVLVGCRRRPGGRRLRLAVYDTGIGIPEDQFETVFEEFRQVGPSDGSDGSGKGGMGLGLAIVRDAAALLRHPLTVRSAVGHGSCFAIDLPVADDSTSSGQPP